MSQKTPSEQADTSIIKEIRNEFSGLFGQAEKKTHLLLTIYPKLIFISMVLLIIFSSIATFLVPIEKQMGKSENSLREERSGFKAGASNELNLLLDLGGRARRLYHLQNEIERLLEKGHLTEEDSAFLNKALQELEYFDNQNQKADEDKLE